MAHFEIGDLTFSYPAANRPALDHINLTIEKGQYVTVCGKSGSGKTTLLRHLKTVLTPHGQRSGDIFFNGVALKEVSLREQSAQIGYVMQNPDSQLVTDKVWHELAFGLESLGMAQETIRLRVAEMASYFGIQSWFHQSVTELSGGQKQLLNLASIMAMQPSVLILDEPTSQLDPIAAADFLNTVRKINLELGTTILITEHRLEDIFHASDKVVVMDKGSIAVSDTPRAVAKFLWDTASDMCAAMPSPVQIYYGAASGTDCPLTVREGRHWLSTVFRERPPAVTALCDVPQPEADGAAPAVEVKDVWFRYEKEQPDVLRGLSLRVPRQSLYAIVGGNGTGKSTALKAICHICKPYRGQVYIDGKRVDKYAAGTLFKGTLALLPQEVQSLFVKKTVAEELEEMGGTPQQVAQAAETCQITALMDSHPYDLSGGEQQRTALAKILLTQPKILLLDEPTKGIDNFFKQQFAAILQQLKAQGVSIVMVSHDVEFCARYADTVSMFFDGGIVTTNTPRRFFSRNSFYTTAANRMSRHLFENAITNEDVIALCRENEKT